MTMDQVAGTEGRAERVRRDDAVPVYRSNFLRLATGLTALGVGVAAVFFAGDGYFSPTQRGVLFFLIAALPAIMFAAEAAAEFRFTFPQFAFSAGGGTAVMMGFLFLLFQLTSPDYVTLTFSVVGDQGAPIPGLSRPDVVDVASPRGAPPVSHYIDGNVLILQFPEQTPTATVTIRPHAEGPIFRGDVSYTSPPNEIRLGVDLLRVEATR